MAAPRRKSKLAYEKVAVDSSERCLEQMLALTKPSAHFPDPLQSILGASIAKPIACRHAGATWTEMICVCQRDGIRESVSSATAGSASSAKTRGCGTLLDKSGRGGRFNAVLPDGATSRAPISRVPAPKREHGTTVGAKVLTA
jgi:hypothetical protein